MKRPEEEFSSPTIADNIIAIREVIEKSEIEHGALLDLIYEETRKGRANFEGIDEALILQIERSRSDALSKLTDLHHTLRNISLFLFLIMLLVGYIAFK